MPLESVDQILLVFVNSHWLHPLALMEAYLFSWWKDCLGHTPWSKLSLIPLYTDATSSFMATLSWCIIISGVEQGNKLVCSRLLESRGFNGISSSLWLYWGYGFSTFLNSSKEQLKLKFAPLWFHEDYTIDDFFGAPWFIAIFYFI